MSSTKIIKMIIRLLADGILILMILMGRKPVSAKMLGIFARVLRIFKLII